MLKLDENSANSSFVTKGGGPAKTTEGVKEDVFNTLVAPEVLKNYNSLREWIKNNLNGRELREVVLEQLSALGFRERYSLERLTVGNFINIFKENPWIKYYFLFKLSFYSNGKFFTRSNITKNDITKFIEELGIRYLSDEEYREMALCELREAGITTKKRFINYYFSKNCLQTLGFRYILEKKYGVGDLSKMRREKKEEIADFLFDDDLERQRAMNEITEELKKNGIENFTSLLLFVYGKDDNSNIIALEAILTGLSQETKDYFSYRFGLSLNRLRGLDCIIKLANALGYLEIGLDKYKGYLISRIKGLNKTLAGIKYDIEVTKKQLIKLSQEVPLFYVYLKVFVLGGEGIVRNLDDNKLKIFFEDFGIIQLRELSDEELKDGILQLASAETFSEMNLVDFINDYKNNPYIREYFRRFHNIGGISRLRMSLFNKFLTFISN